MGLSTFIGGVHPYEGKELSADKPIQVIQPKGELVYPLSQHIGAPAKPLVAKGDKVLVGQKIAEAGGFISANVICSVSGTVKGIEPRLVANGAIVQSIIVENDNEYTAIEGFGEKRDYTKLSKEEMRKKRTDMQIIFQDPYSSLNPRMTVSETIEEPLKLSGMIPDKDQRFTRVLELMDTSGSPECYDMSAQYIMDMSKQAAYKAACEGIVLLKNENEIFPIRSKGKAGNDSVFETVSDEEVMSGVVLCGSGAIRLYDCGTGSAGITTDKDSSIYEGLIQNGVEVSIGIPAAGKRAGISTYICVARIPGMEGNDRKNMKLSAEDAQILNQMLDLKRENPMVKLGLILNVSGPVDLALWEHELDGIFCMFLPGMEGGHAMADILTGRVNPSRRSIRIHRRI